MDEELESVLDERTYLAERRVHEADLASRPVKMPGKVVLSLEALAWRSEELARNAFAAQDHQDSVPAALLSRALMESAGGILILHNFIANRLNMA